MSSTSSASDSNIFNQVLTDAKGVKEKLLGPDYPYYKNIRDPSALGVSSKGTLSTLGKDIAGLIEYTKLLVSGNSKASATGQPLGNKFFLQTGAKCSATDASGTATEQDRYVYINNVPQGHIPLISSGLGTNFTEFRGLVPGAIENLNALNPFEILQAFTMGGTPACQPITLETIDVNNAKSTETHYVATADISNMDPCIFPNRRNPVTGAKCKETMENRGALRYSAYEPATDMWDKIFFSSAGLLAILVWFQYTSR